MFKINGKTKINYPHYLILSNCKFYGLVQSFKVRHTFLSKTHIGIGLAYFYFRTFLSNLSYLKKGGFMKNCQYILNLVLVILSYCLENRFLLPHLRLVMSIVLPGLKTTCPKAKFSSIYAASMLVHS